MAKTSIDKALIRELAKLLDETGLTEIEWEHEGGHVRVARTPAPVPMQPLLAPPPSPSTGAAAEPDGVSLDDHPGAVTSPMVGTAYTSPEPGTPPFVKVGDTVSEGQTLLIVEAMKTMNPIPAPRSGIVTRILVSNEQPVEYGQVLMIVE